MGEFLKQLADIGYRSAPSAAALFLGIVALFGAQRILRRRERHLNDQGFRSQLIMVGLFTVVALTVLLLLPLKDSQRAGLFSLLGIVISASIVLSSTTILGNGLAGLMLRGLRNFRPGDFLEVGEHFGRVTDRGLVHTEIQTEDRDLVTLPNLYLVGQPMKVVRSSGTIVSAKTSLGYDVPRGRIEACLLEAAAAVELADPFVQVTHLGDFSVTYRVAGLLTEVRQLLTARSRLRKAMLDSLHAADIEILSPSFMNTRVFEPHTSFVPSQGDRVPVEAGDGPAAPEALMFDKAEDAATLEELRQEYEREEAQLAELDGQVSAEKEELRRGQLSGELTRLQAHHEELTRSIQELQDGLKADEQERAD